MAIFNNYVTNYQRVFGSIYGGFTWNQESPGIAAS